MLGVDTAHSLRAVLGQAMGEARPDAVLVTGDVAHDPTEQSYDRVRAILAEFFDGPTLCLPGNHDVAESMGDLLQTTELVLGRWLLVALDSHVDDTPEAEVSDADFARVRDAIGCHSEHFVIVATHHPPVQVDCPWLDKDRIQNAQLLLEWLSERPSVKGMVFGHAHQVVEATYRELPLMGTPSTCFQFAPRSENFAVDTAMPGYRWLTLSPEGGVTSEVRRVQDYPLRIDLSDR